MWRSILALLTLFAASFSQAQDNSRWVGQRVVAKYGTSLRTGDQVVYVDNVFRVYRVQQEQGEWLWLETDGIAGWVQPSEVIPVDQAVDYYSQQINASPGTASNYVFRGMIWSTRTNPTRPSPISTRPFASTRKTPWP